MTREKIFAYFKNLAIFIWNLNFRGVNFKTWQKLSSNFNSTVLKVWRKIEKYNIAAWTIEATFRNNQI